MRSQSPPPGFCYRPGLLTTDEEQELVCQIEALEFAEFDFRGYIAKRRVLSFGWHYDFGEEALHPADAIPDFLIPLRRRAADFAEVAPDALAHALITEYRPGTQIGWHRDKGVFEEVIGISLLSSCLFRLRRRAGRTWERYSLELPARSAYLLRGPARTAWEHSIPPVAALRYSITFRSLRPR